MTYFNINYFHWFAGRIYKLAWRFLWSCVDLSSGLFNARICRTAAGGVGIISNLFEEKLQVNEVIVHVLKGHSFARPFRLPTSTNDLGNERNQANILLPNSFARIVNWRPLAEFGLKIGSFWGETCYSTTSCEVLMHFDWFFFKVFFFGNFWRFSEPPPPPPIFDQLPNANIEILQLKGRFDERNFIDRMMG